MEKILTALDEKNDGVAIALFRMVFGFFTFLLMIKYIKLDYAFFTLNGPEILFKYQFLKWLPIFPLAFNKFLLGLALLSSIGVFLGFYYRWAIVIFTIIFAYFFLADETLYNNHLYLILLCGIILSLIPAHKKWSLDSKRLKNRVPSNQNWHLYLIRLQLFFVYFFGSVHKVQADWLNGNIAQSILQNSNSDFIKVIFNNPTGLQFFVWGGILLDLGMALGFLYKRTFWLALVLAIIFHFNNALLFDDIGIFPYMMLLMSVVFIPEKTSTRIKRWLEPKTDEKKKKKSTSKVPVTTNQKTTTGLTIIQIAGFVMFLLFQTIIPLRHYFMTTNPEWSGVAQKFSWRMKLMSKEIPNANFFLINTETGTTHPLEYASFVTSNQKKHLFDDPSYVIQLGAYIKAKVKNEGIKDCKIWADYKVAQNGHPAQRVIQEKIDISELKDNYLSDPYWLIPLSK